MSETPSAGSGPDPVLEVALTQFGALLEGVEDWSASTPCEQWSVAGLADHVVGSTRNFVQMARGEEVDWAASPEVGADKATAFEEAAGDLRAALAESSATVPTGMFCGEYAVHTWDLATASGQPISELDPAVAEAGHDFMRANLTDQARGAAFGPAQAAPDGADAYTAVAAFAGRTVT